MPVPLSFNRSPRRKCESLIATDARQACGNARAPILVNDDLVAIGSVAGLVDDDFVAAFGEFNLEGRPPVIIAIDIDVRARGRTGDAQSAGLLDIVEIGTR